MNLITPWPSHPERERKHEHLLWPERCQVWSFFKLFSFNVLQSSGSCCFVAQSCPTLCDSVDCSLPGSSVHGNLQTRILEWFAISFSREFSQPRDLLMVALRSQGNWRWEGPLGTPLGLVHWKRASSPVEAGTAGYL